MKVLKSSRIYFEDGMRNGYLVLDKDRIAGFLDKDTDVDHYDDYGSQRIIPGIFDTHDHGIYGYGDSELGKTHDDALIKDDLKHYLHSLTFEGVTNIFPTETDTLKQVAEIAKEGYAEGAYIQGIHSEGPDRKSVV